MYAIDMQSYVDGLWYAGAQTKFKQTTVMDKNMLLNRSAFHLHKEHRLRLQFNCFTRDF